MATSIHNVFHSPASRIFKEEIQGLIILHEATFITPNQELACLYSYLNIINTFLTNDINLTVNCPRNSKLALKFK